MMGLEALVGLWFWAQLSSAILLPSAPASMRPACAVLEDAWHTPDAAWREPVQAAAWRAYWQARTGCCVDFVRSPDAGGCRGKVRMVQQKTLKRTIEAGWPATPEGKEPKVGASGPWQAVFVAVACGA